MKNKEAWTLVELMLAMAVVIMISTFLIGAYKPNIQKAKIYAYAMIRNISLGTISVIEKYEANVDESSKDLSYQNPSSTDDTFCVEITDAFALDEIPVCNKNSAISVVNARFPNGATIQGLTNPWKKPYVTASYSFKNIVLDIDGEKGLNKVWVDRFPLRIYQGAKYEGTIQPVDCSDDSIYDDENHKIVLTDSLGKSPYCKQRFNANGADVNKTIIDDDNIITFDVYSAPATGGMIKAKLVASSQSPVMADCMAYGGNGFYSREVCAKYRAKISSACASEGTCDGCSSVSPSICPMNAENTAQTNESSCLQLGKDIAVGDADIRCLTIAHKPSGGMSMILESVIGDIDQ